MTLRVADVAIDARQGGAEAVYTYQVFRPTSPGSAHIVQVGPKRHVGYVVRCYEAEGAELGFEPELLKPLGQRVDRKSVV